TLVLTPQTDLRELDYQQIAEEGGEVLALLEGMHAKNVVVDFHKTDYFGSSALKFFLELRHRVQEREGRMAFCNVSAHQRELFRLTLLDRLWPVLSSRDEALAAVRG